MTATIVVLVEVGVKDIAIKEPVGVFNSTRSTMLGVEINLGQAFDPIKNTINLPASIGYSDSVL